MTFHAVTSRNRLNNKVYAWIYRGEFEEIRDILPPDMISSYIINAKNYPDARKEARKMFNRNIVVANGIVNN